MTSDTDVAITLKAQDWNIVLSALAELAFRVSAPLIKQIQDQAAAADEQ